MYKIYKITNTKNGKSYIGQTKRTIVERWNEHKKSSKKPKYPFQYAIKKYGLDCWDVILISETDDKIIANKNEIYYIQYYKTHIDLNGYNVAIGGNGGDLGKKANEKRKRTISNRTDEEWKIIKKKLSNASKNKTPDVIEKHCKAALGNTNALGYKHTNKTKEIISKANKGKRRTSKTNNLMIQTRIKNNGNSKTKGSTGLIWLVNKNNVKIYVENTDIRQYSNIWQRGMKWKK